MMSRTLEEDVRKFLGLPPHGPLNPCAGDGYFLAELGSRYGAEAVNREIERQKNPPAAQPAKGSFEAVFGHLGMTPDEVGNEMIRLREQRDELVAALSKCAEYLDTTATCNADRAVAASARAAIAKATGQEGGAA